MHSITFEQVSQEAISAATIGYYSSLLRDPLAGAPSTYGAFGQQAVGNVFSKEGAEVFASGFFMGGLAGPYQQVLFQGMPAIFRKGQSIYNKSTVKEGETAADPYTEYNAAREKAVDDVVNYINKINDQQMNAEKPLEAILLSPFVELFILNSKDELAPSELGTNLKSQRCLSESVVAPELLIIFCVFVVF